MRVSEDRFKEQKHIQEININMKHEEDDHLNFIDTLFHFKP